MQTIAFIGNPQCICPGQDRLVNLTGTVLQLDTSGNIIIYDRTSHHLDIRQHGNYRIIYVVTFSAGASGVREAKIERRRNGTNTIIGTAQVTANHEPATVAVVDTITEFAEGDTVRFYVRQNTASGLRINQAATGTIHTIRLS